MKTPLLSTLLIAVLGRFLGEEVKTLFTWVSKSLRQIAVARLPEVLRERYEEEWEGAAADYPGEIVRFLFSIGLLRAATAINQSFREAGCSNLRFQRTKRVFDILFASTVLLYLLPMLILIALAIKLESRGPIFSVFTRIGKKGEIFYLTKFRTVRHGEILRSNSLPKNHSTDQAIDNGPDEHVTRVGKLLRKFSLDHLPVLLSVLRGDMSIVGPHPSLHSSLALCGLTHFGAFQLAPGLTGPWLLRTFGRHPQTHPESLEDFCTSEALEGIYSRDWNVLQDLKILILTLGRLLAG